MQERVSSNRGRTNLSLGLCRRRRVQLRLLRGDCDDVRGKIHDQPRVVRREADVLQFKGAVPCLPVFANACDYLLVREASADYDGSNPRN